MDVKLPSGTVIIGIPDGTSREDIKRKAISAGIASEEDFSEISTSEQQKNAGYKSEVVSNKILEYKDDISTLTRIRDKQDKDSFEYRKLNESIDKISTKISDLQSMDQMQAEQIVETTKLAASGVGFQTGLRDIGRGLSRLIGKPVEQDETIKKSIDALTKQSPEAEFGRMAGQAAPFLVPGGAISGVASLPARAALAGGLGGVEGAAITAADEKNDANKILVGAGLGVLIGAGAEVAYPYLNRAGRKLLRDKGVSETINVVDANGNMTAKFKEFVDKEDINFSEELAKQQSSKKVITEIAEEAGKSKSDIDKIVSAIKPSKKRVEAAERLGLDDIPSPVLSESQPYQELGGITAAVPGTMASETLDKFAERLGLKADEIIQEMGGSLDTGFASDRLKRNMQKARDAIYAREGAAYDAVSVPKRTKVNSKKLIQAIEEDAKDLGGVENLSAPSKRIYKKLNDSPTYGLLDQERKEIGAALQKKEGAYKDANTAELGKLYSMLTQLQEGVARQFGAGDAWDSAKALTKERKGLEESITALFGKNINESATAKVIQGLKKADTGDISQFTKAINEIPKDEQGPIVATAMNAVFTSRRGNKSFTASDFNKWFSGVKRSQTAKKAIADALPDGGIQRLEDLAEIAKGMAAVTGKRTRTGIAKVVLDDFDKANGLAAKLYGLAGAAENVPGVSQAVRMTSRVVAAASKDKTKAVDAIDNLLASKEFKRAVYETARNPDGAKAKRFQRELQQTDIYKKFISSINSSSASAISAAGLIPYLSRDEEED